MHQHIGPSAALLANDDVIELNVLHPAGKALAFEDAGLGIVGELQPAEFWTLPLSMSEIASASQIVRLTRR